MGWGGSMRRSRVVKPLSFVKSHAAEVICGLEKSRETIIITYNGEAKAVLQDIREYENSQESLAMLKILALGKKEAEEGRCELLDDAFGDLKRVSGEALE
jgi:hypothetical protein